LSATAMKWLGETGEARSDKVGAAIPPTRIVEYQKGDVSKFCARI